MKGRENTRALNQHCACYFVCFIYFWLHWVLVASHGLSLVAASRGHSQVAVCGLLILVAFLVAEHSLWNALALVAGVRGLSSCGSWTLELGLSSCSA